MIVAPPHYKITITGDANYAANRDFIAKGLGYLLARLFKGDTVAEDALEAYGLKVTVEGDPSAVA